MYWIFDKTVCKRHFDEQLDNTYEDDNKFKCELCHEEDSVPKNGLFINEHIKNALDIKINTMAVNFDIYNQCEKEIEEASKNLANIETLQKNAENFIYDYFEDIKKKIDLRREELKVKIDEVSDEMIKSVENNKLIKESSDKRDWKIGKEFDWLSIHLIHLLLLLFALMRRSSRILKMMQWS